MMYKSKKSNVVIAAILFIVAAAFFIYGIYMVIYSIDYIRAYMEISTITADNAFQYVITSSATYLGFAVVIFAAGFIIFSMRKTNYESEIPQDSEAQTATLQDDELDLLSENNPYYTSPPKAAPPATDNIEGVSNEAASCEKENEISKAHDKSPEKTAPENDIYKDTVRAFSKLPKAPLYKDVVIPDDTASEENPSNSHEEQNASPISDPVVIDKNHETDLLERLEKIKETKLPQMNRELADHINSPYVQHEPPHGLDHEKWIKDFFEENKNNK